MRSPPPSASSRHLPQSGATTFSGPRPSLDRRVPLSQRDGRNSSLDVKRLGHALDVLAKEPLGESSETA